MKRPDPSGARPSGGTVPRANVSPASVCETAGRGGCNRSAGLAA